MMAISSRTHQWGLCVQLRVATRVGTQLVSTDFNSRDYYINIRKAIAAGFFMQVRGWHLQLL